MLDMLSSLYKLSIDQNIKKIHSLQIYLDEADIGYHPEWQREWFYIFPQIVERIFDGTNISDIQFFLATHSPLLLGDIPPRCAKYVVNEKNEKSSNGNITIEEYKSALDHKYETFGQNLYTILNNGFFLKKGAIGEVAINKSEEIAEAFKLFRELIMVLGSNKSSKSLIELINRINAQNDNKKAILKRDGILVDINKELNHRISVGGRDEIIIEYDAYLCYIKSLIDQYSSFIRNKLLKEYMEIIASLSMDKKETTIEVINREIERLQAMKNRLEQHND